MTGEADFFGVNPATFAIERVEFRVPGSMLMNMERHRLFELDEHHLYLWVQNTIWRYAFQERTWDPFTMAGGGRPVRLGGRLFFISANNLLEYTPDGSIQVLASSRRRPAVNLLDNLDNYNLGHLFLDSSGAIELYVGNEVYSLPSRSQDWRHEASLPPGRWSGVGLFDDGFLAQVGMMDGDYWGTYGPCAKPQLLFHNVTTRPHPLMPGEKTNPRPAHWHWPAPSSDVCEDKDCLWFLVTPGAPRRENANTQLPPGSGPARDVTLVRFKYDEPDPIAIPIHLAAQETDSMETPTRVPFMIVSRQRMLQATPEGLVLIKGSCAGFWLVPRTGLDQAIASVSERRSAKNHDPAKP
jgi:hypothetical protein